MKRTLILVVLLQLLSSCVVGGGGVITFDRVKYPVSGNHKLLDETGKSVDAERRSEFKGVVKMDHRFWSIGYGFIQLSDDQEWGPEINSKIEEMGGDAMINTRLKSTPCGWDHFTVLIGFLPIVPGCSYTELSGDVVEINP